MKSVKVCCFCEKWESGGIESFLFNVLLHMNLQTVRVDIVTAELAESIFTQPLQEHGIRFFELSGSQRNVRENHLIFKELLQRERYNVVHLNIFHGLSLYYARLAQEAGVPVRIAHSHNTALRQSRTRTLKQVIHWVSKELFTRSATDLWACSSKAAKFLFAKRSLKKSKFRLIPNGIDTNRFQFDPAVRENVRRELGVANKLVIGNVGRLCYQKNQDFLLDIFVEVHHRRPESRLLLVGGGEMEEMLRQKAERLEISNAVIFYGTSACVERLLWAMDIFAFPSRFEGLGIAAVEAQAAGLPVLCTENLPNELNVTNSIQFLPMSRNVWIKKILQTDCGTSNRVHVQDGIAQYDIKKTVYMIEQRYLGGRSRGSAH